MSRLFLWAQFGSLASVSEIEIEKHGPDGVECMRDSVAEEEPLQITVDGFPVAVVMRTPGADHDLVSGFLVTEGFVTTLAEISRIDLEQKDNHALVFLAEGVTFDRAKLSRNLFSASSCGICGKASIDSIRRHYPSVPPGFLLLGSTLLTFPDRLREAQQAFAKTGGIHAAGLFDEAGELLVLREDVGRHNAIDKVMGWALAHGIDLREAVLQVSGRVSFEVMQKALAVGIPVVSAISAPSSLAVDFARESGQTLVGFLRPPSFNVYAGGGRIRVGGSASH